MRTALVAAIFALLPGCYAATIPAAATFDRIIGLAVMKPGGTCLDIRDSTLSRGMRLTLVVPSPPQSVAIAEIAGKSDQSCALEDQDAAAWSHYSLRIVKGSLTAGEPVFALARFNGNVSTTLDGATADIDHDGQPEFFRSCTSSEGVHLTVWSGRPLKGQRRWHHYYYLGYDVEPNCSTAETTSGQL